MKINPRIGIKPRIYISGPISGHDLDERRKVFEMAEIVLKSIGFEPVNPIAEADKHPEDITTHHHMRRDIALLLYCDAIFMMKGWTHSKGCKVEFDVATAIGLPVYFEEVYMESKTDLIEFV